MCGISGIFDPRRALPFSQIETGVRRMIDAFHYRGPDGDGTHFDANDGIGLGHVRLSIIDVAGGGQPMANAESNVWVVFNGEIYNFQEERRALEARGHVFKTKSDTETIIALYLEYGEKAWERLRGQFAFGLWDKRVKKLFLVRDRLGEKPLFYHESLGAVYFASELKGILKCDGVAHRVNPDVLGMYLLTTNVPAPFSIMEGIRKVPPGHYLTVDASGAKLKPFWMPATWPDAKAPRDAVVIDEFRDRFMEAVRLCTVSDVPIGTYLSGGLDSTSVTWSVTQTLKDPFHTFAIFNEDGHERHPDWKYAQEAAAKFGTRHHNVFYTLPKLMAQIPDYVEKSDEPFDGVVNLVSYFLAKEARKHVKVVLTGNGADELLGGYESYYRQVFRQQRMWQRIDRLVPGPVRRAVGAAVGAAHPRLKRMGLPHDDRRVDAGLDYNSRWFDFMCPDAASKTRTGLRESLVAHHALDQRNYIKRYLYEELFIYHQHSITTMPDSTGMACSLEARNPFLDYRLVEFIFSLPPDLLIRPGFNNKYILLRAVEAGVPASIIHRKKEGFSGMTGDQLVQWVRTDGRPVFRDSLLDSALAKDGYFSKAALAELWERYEKAPTVKEAIYYQLPLWATVMLELWYRRHVVR